MVVSFRICPRQYNELNEETGIITPTPWTEEYYDSNIGGEEGFKGCCFNELENFHCTKSMPLDFMHDFLEGKIIAFFLSVFTLRLNCTNCN